VVQFVNIDQCTVEIKA